MKKTLAIITAILLFTATVSAFSACNIVFTGGPTQSADSALNAVNETDDSAAADHSGGKEDDQSDFEELIASLQQKLEFFTADPGRLSYNAAGGFYEYAVDDFYEVSEWALDYMMFGEKYEGLTFETTIDFGELCRLELTEAGRYSQQPMGKTYTSVSGEKIRVNPYASATEQAERVFVDSVIKREDKAVGYLVLEYKLRKPRTKFWAINAVKSAFIYDTEDKDVAVERVKSAIRQAKIGMPDGRLFAYDQDEDVFDDVTKLYELDAYDIFSVDSVFFGDEQTSYNAVRIRYEDDGVVFDAKVNVGGVGYQPQLSVAEMRFYTGDCIFWKASASNKNPMKAFINVTIRSNGRIIGYAVIEVDYIYEDGALKREFLVVKSVIVPMRNGIYQTATEVTLQAAFEKIKDDRLPSSEDDEEDAL
ncbi:MAG: hypothetical protein ILP02_03345, partial [Clostridia bacterium]|nr:hypothetical protein [Clostridia bacterium]